MEQKSIFSQIYFWLFVVGGILIIASIIYYVYSSESILIPIIGGALGALLLIIAVVLAFNQSKKRNQELDAPLEKRIADGVKVKIESVVPQVGRGVARGTQYTGKTISNVSFAAGTALNKYLSTIIDKSTSAVLKVKRIVMIAVLGALLSSTGAGEVLWVSELTGIMGTLGQTMAAGGTSTTGFIGGQAGSALSSIGTSLGSSTLTSAGGNISNVLGKTGVQIGINLGEQFTQEGLNQASQYFASRR